jgi:hypothetical protein
MLRDDKSYNWATKIEESLCHHPFWLLPESAELLTGTRIHAPDLVRPIPMASQVHWVSYNSLTLYLQPTPGVAIQVL